MDGNYSAWGAYGRAKLANYHFALGLQKEFESRGLSAESLVAHPGLSHTNLQVHTVEEGGGGPSAPFWAWMARTTGMSASREIVTASLTDSSSPRPSSRKWEV